MAEGEQRDVDRMAEGMTVTNKAKVGEGETNGVFYAREILYLHRIVHACHFRGILQRNASDGPTVSHN